MSDTNNACCPDCGKDWTAELAALAETQAAMEATKAELRVFLEQRMEAGEDISPVLEQLAREGADIGDLLFN
jgi:hypothetical protein